MKNPSAIILLSISFLLASSAAAQGPLNYRKGPVRIEYVAADKDEIEGIARLIKNGRSAVRTFFGREWPKDFVVQVLPDRGSLDEVWRRDGAGADFKSQCWMVAGGIAAKLTILSPRVWRTEACEHDPSDSADTQRLITHELVHVFHGQMNPSSNFDGMDDVAWFVEGLAAYVSGQLDAGKMATAREAIAAAKVPDELEQVWSGKYRYGMSGSMVRFIDRKYGRKMLVRLLGETTESGILSRLSTTEHDFIENWRASEAR